MDMEMRYAFPAIRAIIDDQTETRVMQAFLLGHGLRNKDEMTQKRFVLGSGCRNARDFLFWNDQDVNRSLRVDIVESQAEIVFINDPGGNFPGDDFGENRAHGFK
jgi:hypothetical protein